MGMYDIVYVDNKILNNNKDMLSCKECGKFPKSYQTKDFDRCMNDYYLSYNSNNKFKFVYLDPPDKDGKFWKKYTKKEADKLKKESVKKDNKFGTSIAEYHLSFGGRFLSKAYLPKNRNKRNMGEFPHQWIEFYSDCKDCDDSWINVYIKFIDGTSETLSNNPPNKPIFESSIF